MRRKTPAMLTITAVLVLGGALGALAQQDGAVDEPAATERPLRAHLRGALIDEMVADGVITDEQAGAIREWLEARRAESSARRAEHKAAWQEAWADGVLTEEEAEAFPVIARLSAGSEAWDDGELTRAEFAALQARLRHLSGRHGPRG